MPDKNTDKISCPVKKCFKYVIACRSLCRHQKKCKALKDYYNPWLWGEKTIFKK